MPKQPNAQKIPQIKITADRVEKAKSEKIYLVNRLITNISASFDVMGSHGTVYNVVLNGIPTCSCPDQSYRGALGYRCKHILFMLVKIFKIDNPNQKQYSIEDIKKYIELYKDNITKSCVVATDSDNVAIRCSDDDECGICLELVKNGEDYVYCKKSCGKCIHKGCYITCSKNKSDFKCIYCMAIFV